MSHILTLSPELHLSIISHLSLSHKRRLRPVCQIFNRLLIFDLPFEQLKAARKENTIFLVENAREGKLGFEPFIIMDVRKVYSDTNKSRSRVSGKPAFPKRRLLLDIYYPKFMRNKDENEYEEEGRTENDWEIRIEMEQLNLDSSNTLLESSYVVESVNYESLRGKLLRASAARLRSRFGCPECDDSRNVCPGCGGFYGRFPDLSCGCGWPMPCPVCIGYEVASEAKDILIHRRDPEDDPTGLEELWVEIIDMLEKEKNPMPPLEYDIWFSGFFNRLAKAPASLDPVQDDSDQE
ncbi:hypothetical protein GGX14DRAFT_481176 [Mycena pura]|uniref:F-box domain-containing protein n=1 Tax=Mycena pura TaxID=153505 RepID=A0AAD6USX6_9AGAR|nr:hypothetical protein GGX14DRAFT_481176 [Mycena pura]